jgi:tryptophan-rich sensory protein
MKSYETYTTYIKPSFAPPSSVFGPVWTVLYIIIAISYISVFQKVIAGEIPKKILIPFILNLVFNFAFTPIQLGLKNNLLASIDIVLVLVTLLWAIISIWPYVRWIAYAQFPYLLWVSFATILQLSITYLNWK